MEQNLMYMWLILWIMPFSKQYVQNFRSENNTTLSLHEIKIWCNIQGFSECDKIP